jgi:hypothetical protein
MFIDLADPGTMGPQATSHNAVQGNKDIMLYLKHFSSIIIDKILWTVLIQNNFWNNEALSYLLGHLT